MAAAVAVAEQGNTSGPEGDALVAPGMALHSTESLLQRLGQQAAAQQELSVKYSQAQQIIEMQHRELAEKSRLIQLLSSKLDRLSGLAAAVADEVQSARCLAASATAADSPSHRHQHHHHQQQQQRSQTASPAAYGRPGPGRLGAGSSVAFKLEASSDGWEQGRPRSPGGFSAFTRLAHPQQPRSQLGSQAPGELAAACAAADGMRSCSGHSGHDLLLHHQQQQNSAGTLGLLQQHAAAAAAAEAEAAAAAGAARAVACASKRPRIHSNGSAVGEAVTAGCSVAPLKRAVSGGSSSSHHLLSSDDEPEEQQGEVNGAAAAATAAAAGPASGRGTGNRRKQQQQRRQVSPGSIEQVPQQVGPVERMDEDETGDEEERSQDERDAASQLLAMFKAASTNSPKHQMSSRTGLSEGRQVPPAMQPQQAAHQQQQQQQQHWQAGSGSSWAQSAQGGPYGSLQTDQLLRSVQPGPHELFDYPGARLVQQQHHHHHHYQQQPLVFNSGCGVHEPQHLQQQQLQFCGSEAAMNEGRRRSEVQDATWGPGKASAHHAGGSAAAGRPRKQSWFQTEIAEKIPLSVQQACTQDWEAQRCMAVVCAELSGTFYVNSAGEFMVKLPGGEVVSPNKFEEMAGKKTARNWQQSIRLVGFTMNGEPNSALLKLGHFTRIVGLVQER